MNVKATSLLLLSSMLEMREIVASRGLLLGGLEKLARVAASRSVEIPSVLKAGETCASRPWHCRHEHTMRPAVPCSYASPPPWHWRNAHRARPGRARPYRARSGRGQSEARLSRNYHWSPTRLFSLVPDQAFLKSLGSHPSLPFSSKNGFVKMKTISSKFSAPLLTVSTAI